MNTQSRKRKRKDPEIRQQEQFRNTNAKRKKRQKPTIRGIKQSGETKKVMHYLYLSIIMNISLPEYISVYINRL